MASIIIMQVIGFSGDNGEEKIPVGKIGISRKGRIFCLRNLLEKVAQPNRFGLTFSSCEPDTSLKPSGT